jgi:hypothetical protein
VLKPVSLDEMRRLCHASLQLVLTTCQETEQMLREVHLPVTPELELQLQKQWHRQFAAWNEYAAATRRLAVVIRQHYAAREPAVC